MMHRSASSAGVPQLRTGRSKLRICRWASGLTLLGIALTSVAWLSPESGCFGSVDGSRFSRRLQIRSGDLAYQWQAPGQPLLTIVTATLPFSASGDNRVRAIESWLQLSPQPTTVLLGNDTSFRELAAAHPQVRLPSSGDPCGGYFCPESVLNSPPTVTGEGRAVLRRHFRGQALVQQYDCKGTGRRHAFHGRRQR